MDLPPPLVTGLDIRDIERRAKELPTARWGRGYRVAEVDAFLTQSVAALRARLAENEGLRMGVPSGNPWHSGADEKPPRTPFEVDEKIFELAFSGYRMREVDELLDEVAHRLAQLEAENELLEARNPAE
ncbi:MAG: DivIVA domain-containing protein [Actinomycetota bacterium]